MPIYPQECTKCGHRFDSYRSIKKHNQNPSCERCGKKTKRILNTAVFSQLDWSKPLISQAMACDPADAPARERATGIKHTPTGEPIFRNKGERASFMKKTGYYDRAEYYGRG